MLSTPLLDAAFKLVASPQQAEAIGWKPLTRAYTSKEHWMLHNALQSLANGKRQYLLVIFKEGHEIWIPGRDFKREKK